MSSTDVINPLQLPEQQKIIKYKCTLCFYDAFNKDNVVKHIKKTAKCSEAQIIEIEIKCDYCFKPFGSEMSKINHEKICKSKKLEDELEDLDVEEQNKLLRRRYHEQNKYVELIEKQLRLLKSKFAREEEVNNIEMQNEHGFSAAQLHHYCVFTLKRLFGELTFPAISEGIDLARMKREEKKRLTAEAGGGNIAEKKTGRTEKTNKPEKVLTQD